MTMAASALGPAARASAPNDSPKATLAIASESAPRRPARMPVRSAIRRNGGRSALARANTGLWT
jgi:hypothetical protein